MWGKGCWEVQYSPAKLTSPRITTPLRGEDKDEGPEAGMTQVWGVERTEEIGVYSVGTVRAVFQGSVGPSALDQIPKGAAGLWALPTLSEGLTYDRGKNTCEAADWMEVAGVKLRTLLLCACEQQPGPAQPICPPLKPAPQHRPSRHC